MCEKWAWNEQRKTSVPGFAMCFLLIALTYTLYEQNVGSKAIKTFNAIQTKLRWQSESS